MSEFDLRALLEALNEQGVRFVVIGGVAVGAHGYPRATADLDLVPDSDPENLDRLIVALDSLDATLPTVGGRAFDSGSDAGVIRRGGNWTKTRSTASCSACRKGLFAEPSAGDEAGAGSNPGQGRSREPAQGLAE